MVKPIVSPLCIWPTSKVIRASNMKSLDKEDMDVLESLDCFKKITIKNGHGAGYAPYIGYRLVSVYWKKRFMGLLQPRKIEEYTPYVFIVGDSNHYGWFKNDSSRDIGHARGWCFHHDDGWKIPFEDVFDDIPDDLKCKLIYHLDVFNPK